MKKNILLSSILMTLSLAVNASFEENGVEKSSVNISKKSSFNLIVKFKDKNIHKSLLSTNENVNKINRESKKLKVSASSLRIKYNVQNNISEKHGISKLKSFGQKHDVNFNHVRSMSMGADVVKIDYTGYLESQKLIQSLRNSGDFESVMLDINVTKMDYNDPLFVEQYHLKSYSSSNLYGQNYVAMKDKVINNLGRKLRMGIADTGYAPHEDINIHTEGYDFVSSTEFDTDGNYMGNLTEPEVRDGDPQDSAILSSGEFCHDGHGLSVAGLIAAKTNNGLGVAGVMDSEKVDLVYSRVLDCFGNGTISGILDSVAWMSGISVPNVPNISKPVDIINLSLGGFSSSGCGSYEQEIYDKARENGVVVFVAAGNSNAPASTFTPASCNNVITVGATTDNGDKASFSNYGEHVDITAAGDSVDMLASDAYIPRIELYFKGSGTSMASPNAAGGGGNLLLTYPELTPEQIESLMIANGRGNSESSICGQLGCGGGAVDMSALMDAMPNVLSETSYSKKHRYEGYNSPNQQLWLKEMDSYSNTCDMIKYTWGKVGIEVSGISHKLYISENGSDFVYTDTVLNPQKIYNHTDSTLVGVQSCKGEICGDIIQMKGLIITPEYCSD
jgi:serine protease